MTERAWTPERVEQLIGKVDELGDYLSDLVLAEERVAEVLEYLKADTDKAIEKAKLSLVEDEEPPEAGE